MNFQKIWQGGRGLLMVTHDEFVGEIMGEIQSLGLLTLKIPSYLSKGFKPDILVMCGADEGDRVFIEAINSRGSLNRDIGSLLKLKANLDKDNIQYRRMIVVCSEKIPNTDLDYAYALETTQSKFHLLRIQELRYWLRDTAIGAMREKLNQFDKEKLEWYFANACPNCGSFNITKVYEHEQINCNCSKCGFSWIKTATV